MRRFVVFGSLFVFVATLLAVAQDSKDTPKAAATRKKLKQRVSVDYTDESIRAVADDLNEKLKDVRILIDSKGGVSGNIKITYKADNQPLDEVFEGMFKKNGLGYIVISKPGNAYDGNVLIKQGPERGYEKGQEPDPTASKDKDKPAPDKPVVKDKPAPKDKNKDKPAAKDKPEENSDKTEQEAARKLNFAKTFVEDGKTAKAKERLEEIVTKYPKTKAADQARELLKNLKN